MVATARSLLVLAATIIAPAMLDLQDQIVNTRVELAVFNAYVTLPLARSRVVVMPGSDTLV